MDPSYPYPPRSYAGRPSPPRQVGPGVPPTQQQFPPYAPQSSYGPGGYAYAGAPQQAFSSTGVLIYPAPRPGDAPPEKRKRKSGGGAG
jgi:hypothetical protein